MDSFPLNENVEAGFDRIGQFRELEFFESNWGGRKEGEISSRFYPAVRKKKKKIKIEKEFRDGEATTIIQ